MKKITLQTLKASLFIGFSLLTNTAFAGGGGTIGVSYGAENVPSLSGIMLVVLSLLLFAIAFRTAKQKQDSKLFVSLLGVGALISALAGAGKFTYDMDAQAGIWAPVSFFNQSTTTISFNRSTVFKNNDPVLTATINSLTYDSRFFEEACSDPRNTCRVGVKLAPSGQCYIICSFR